MMAKQVVQLRKQQEKLYKGKAQLNGVSQMAKSAQATQSMMKGMQTATGAMQLANAQMQPAETQRMMMEFERQSAQEKNAVEFATGRGRHGEPPSRFTPAPANAAAAGSGAP